MTLSIKSVLCAALLVTALSITSSAQERSATTTTPKSTLKTLSIDTAQVVYVSGDDAVLKMPDGRLHLFELSPGTSMTIDGKPSTAADLQQGTTLSHVRMRSRTESDVTTVTQINGTITAKNGRFVTLRLDDGASKIYRVPYHATFNVGGQDTTYDNVKKGMKIAVTAVKTEGLSTVSQKAAMLGQTPQQTGTLVIEK